MRKMILLAAMSAIAALMLAATPAFAQQGNLPAFRDVDDFLIKPGDCGIGEERFGGEQLTREETLDLEGVDEDELPGGVGTPKFCVIFPDDNNGNGDDNRDNRDNVVVPVFEIDQDLDQEAESGDVNQSFDVSQTGDNSNQTVGIQGVANTGNAQNQIGVIDAGNGFGNFDGNNDDRFFFDDNNNDEDFCDFFDCDNDDEDFCDFFDCDDNDDDHGFFVFDDDDNDRFFGNNGGDVEFDNVGSTIEVSPTNTTSGDQQVNQAATAFGS
jgi:hypothetical protein